MKCHHPDVFLAAILNAQPMGFYAPAQLVRDAREHGVEVRPVDVNRSQWDCTLQKTVTPYHAVRLGFCMVRSLKQKDGRGSCRSNGLHGRDDFFMSIEGKR
jgi:error-prone DNA polymerase